MNDKTDLKSLVEAANSGKRFPALKIASSDPERAAVISKLVKSPEVHKVDLNKKSSYYALNQSQIQAISDQTKGRITDGENALRLFPDIKRCVRILISSILSPKDMIKTELIYGGREDILPNAVMSTMNDIVRSNIEGYYGLDKKLSTILEDMLFRTGSYTQAVIPESIVDELINNRSYSREAMSDMIDANHRGLPIGILGNPGNGNSTNQGPLIPAIESFAKGDSRSKGYSNSSVTFDFGDNNKITTEGLLEVTDNFKLLKLPKAMEQIAKKNIRKVLKTKIATESNKLSNDELSSLLYKDPMRNQDTFLTISTKRGARRKSIGRPLEMYIPSEAVIPVYVPGDYKRHIGYFVLTDVYGNPVTRDSRQDHTDGLTSILNGQNQSNSLSSLLLAKASHNLANTNYATKLDNMMSIYSSVVERDLLERLKNGIYGEDLSISNNEEIYRIMLARTLSSQYTRLIYIPEELVTYFAFDYFDNGVGKSYLDDIRILTGIRAMLMFAKVMAQIKSAINVTHVDITLDPEDPDPMKTIEMAQHDIARLRQQYFPLGINNPVDLVDWLQRAGQEYTFEGHAGLPKTKFNFETRNLQHQVPDADLDEELKRQTYMSFNLAPEMVDSSFDVEFASVITQNNILHAQIAYELQDIFTEKLTSHVKRLIDNDPVIIEGLKETLKNNIGKLDKFLTDEYKELKTQNEELFYERMVEIYKENLELSLPRADTVSLSNKKDAFSTYKEAIEEAIDYWWDTTVVPQDLAGEFSSSADTVKGVLLGHYLRTWMAQNDYLPELAEMASMDDEGNPLLNVYDITQEHIKTLVTSGLKFMKSLKQLKFAADKDVQSLQVEGSDSSSGGEDTSADDTGGGEDDLMGGLDDMGGGSEDEDPLADL